MNHFNLRSKLIKQIENNQNKAKRDVFKNQRLVVGATLSNMVYKCKPSVFKKYMNTCKKISDYDIDDYNKAPSLYEFIYADKPTRFFVDLDISFYGCKKKEDSYKYNTRGEKFAKKVIKLITEQIKSDCKIEKDITTLVYDSSRFVKWAPKKKSDPYYKSSFRVIYPTVIYQNMKMIMYTLKKIEDKVLLLEKKYKCSDKSLDCSFYKSSSHAMRLPYQCKVLPMPNPQKIKDEDTLKKTREYIINEAKNSIFDYSDNLTSVTSDYTHNMYHNSYQLITKDEMENATFHNIESYEPIVEKKVKKTVSTNGKTISLPDKEVKIDLSFKQFDELIHLLGPKYYDDYQTYIDILFTLYGYYILKMKTQEHEKIIDIVCKWAKQSSKYNDTIALNMQTGLEEEVERTNIRQQIIYGSKYDNISMGSFHEKCKKENPSKYYQILGLVEEVSDENRYMFLFSDFCEKYNKKCIDDPSFEKTFNKDLTHVFAYISSASEKPYRLKCFDYVSGIYFKEATKKEFLESCNKLTYVMFSKNGNKPKPIAMCVYIQQKLIQHIYHTEQFLPDHDERAVIKEYAGRKMKTFNTYDGYSVQPMCEEEYNNERNQNDLKDILYHIEYRVCDKENHNKTKDNYKEKYEYLLNWYAMLLQKRKKIKVALIFASEKHGTGKSICVDILKKILLKYSLTIEAFDKFIKGDFSSEARKERLLQEIDEIPVKTTKSAEHNDKIKSMITGDTYFLNSKNKTQTKAICHNNYIFTTNHVTSEKLSIEVASSDRRFVFYHVNDLLLKEDEQEAERIGKLFNSNNSAKLFLTFLLKRDISKFIPTKLFKSELKDRLKETDPLDNWMKDKGYKYYNTLQCVSQIKFEIEEYSGALSYQYKRSITKKLLDRYNIATKRMSDGLKYVFPKE